MTMTIFFGYHPKHHCYQYDLGDEKTSIFHRPTNLKFPVVQMLQLHKRTLLAKQHEHGIARQSHTVDS